MNGSKTNINPTGNCSDREREPRHSTPAPDSSAAEPQGSKPKLTSLAVLATLRRPASLSATAGEPRPFAAYLQDAAQVVVSRQGEDYLGLNVIAWGPNWAWMGLDGSSRNEQGVAVGTLAGKVSGTGVPIRVAFRMSRPAPQRLQFEYELQAEQDTALTYVVLELSPGKTFEGRDVVVQSQGRQSSVRCPFERRGLGERVDSVRMTDAQGGVTAIRFDPPCEIPTDGAARIVLAKDKLPGNAARRLTISVELPGPLDFYPSVADLPDEPGIATWYPWQATGDTGASAIGLDDWLDRPAGKHGRIVRQGDQLLVNGQPIKLWGLNLCYGTCAPEKELADKRAAFYRKYGINSVRLHKYADGPGWAGIQSPDSFAEFDAEGLDRMDYQVAKFKEAGIYVKLSAHFGSQKLGPADKQYVPYLDEFGTLRGRDARIETPHSAVHYSPELQRLQILQMVNLLQHKNPYTGMTYAQDPAIAFLEIINEQSILFYSSMAPLKASPTLRKQVAERFCDWLDKKYGGQQQLAAAWGKDAFDSFAGEGFPSEGERLDKKNILPLGNPWFWDPVQLSGSQAFRRQRLLDSLQFLYELQCEFFQRYVAAVRQAGYQGEILSSNWQAGRAYSHLANLHSDYLVGTIDRHNYFGAGQANASMLARAGSGMLSSGMQQVLDRPFMLSEWIHVFPNELGVEGPAIIGAYGLGLQGWDVSYLFQNRDNGGFNDRIGRDQWEVTAPQVLGLFPAVARQVHRGDVQQSEVTAVRNVHVPSLFEGRLSFDDTVAQGYDDKELDSSKVSSRALAVARSVIAFTDKYADTPAFDLAPYQRDGQLVSSTGQLRWQERGANSGGFFTMNTPGTAAVVGFAAGQRCELGSVTIEPAEPVRGHLRHGPRSQGNDRLGPRAADCGPGASAQYGHEVLTQRRSDAGPRRGPDRDGAGQGQDHPPPTGSPRVVLLDHDGRPTAGTLEPAGGTLTIDGARDRTPYYLVRY